MIKHMPVPTQTGTYSHCDETNQQKNVVIKKVGRSPSANNCFSMKLYEWQNAARADALDIKS